MEEIVKLYKPDACVIQCGADSIVGDPLGSTNLIPEDFGCCIEQILSWNLPTMFLGGGKYSNKKFKVHHFILFFYYFIKTFIEISNCNDKQRWLQFY